MVLLVGINPLDRNGLTLENFRQLPLSKEVLFFLKYVPLIFGTYNITELYTYVNSSIQELIICHCTFTQVKKIN